jgi:hypothetical protein
LLRQATRGGLLHRAERHLEQQSSCARGVTNMATERSLYDRLGGIDAVTAVVRAVTDRQLHDDRINQKFANTNKDG